MVTSKVPDPPILAEVIRRIVEVAHPDRIVLFGSAARGQMGPDSDLRLPRKAIKAVLVHRAIRLPKTHAIAELLSLAAQNDVEIPPDVSIATDLTTHAVESRYPGMSESVSREEWIEAVASADRVLRWAQAVIGPPGN